MAETVNTKKKSMIDCGLMMASNVTLDAIS